MQDGCGCERRRGELGVGRLTIGELDQPVSLGGNFGIGGEWESLKRKYSEDFKRQVAEEYLSGQGSSMAIAEKYHLRSGNLVLDWVKAYHERNSKRERGGTIMRNDHTIEERLEAVLACLEGGRTLQEVAQAHQVAVQTLRSWVKKYQELGPAGLEDRRGKRLADQTPRSRDEALRIENARLKKENELLKMELYLRKKVQELERGDR